jgi:hypothetical protein
MVLKTTNTQGKTYPIFHEHEVLNIIENVVVFKIKYDRRRRAKE